LGERRELQTRLDEAQRVLAQQRTFQQQFRNTLYAERAMRSHELSLLLALRAKYVAAQAEVLAANQAYAGLARTREDALFADNLAEQLRITTSSLDRFERLVASLRNSPYLRAMEDHVTVAFVPYDNLQHTYQGTPLYRCLVGIFACKRVGVTGVLLDGEVTEQHPIRNNVLRGAMVEVRLDDGAGAREKLLHVGHPPLFF